MMSRPHAARVIRLLPLIGVSLLFGHGTAHAQVLAGPYPYGHHRHHHAYPYHYRHYHPVDIIAARIHAQADLIESVSYAQVNYAHARVINQDAIKKLIENKSKMLKYFKERRHYQEEKKADAIAASVNRKHLQAGNIWDRIASFPEFTWTGVTKAQGPNWLLNRLSGTILSYEYSGSPGSRDDYSDIDELKLSPEVRKHIYLREHVPGGAGLVFSASEGVPKTAPAWPFEMRQPELNYHRKQFETAWQQIIKEAGGGEISVKAFDELDTALDKLEKQFKARNDKKHRFRKGVDSWKRYYTSLLFLRSLWGEISRLKDTRDPSGVFGGGRKFQGDNLIELLKYMSRNGLVFAPAPNVDDHFAYHSVFKQMRDLYVTVADDDPALKPVRPRSRN